MPSYNGQNLSTGTHNYGDLAVFAGQNLAPPGWKSGALAVYQGQNLVSAEYTPTPGAPTDLQFNAATHRLSWSLAAGSAPYTAFYRIIDNTNNAVVGSTAEAFFDVPRAWAAGGYVLKIRAFGWPSSLVSADSATIAITVTGGGLGSGDPPPETPVIEGPFAALDFANQEVLVHWKLHGTGWVAGNIYIADAITGVQLPEVNNYGYDVAYDALANAFVLPVPGTIFGKRIKVHFSATLSGTTQHKYSDAFTVPGSTTGASSGVSSGVVGGGAVPGMGAGAASGGDLCSRRLDPVGTTEFSNRMFSVMPNGWLGTPEEAVNAIGIFRAWGNTHRQFMNNVVGLQSALYLHLATGNALDALAADYFGEALARRRLAVAGTSESVPESDAAFRARIKQALLLPAGTPTGMRQAIQALMSYTDAQALTNIVIEDPAALSAGSSGGWAVGGIYDPGPVGGTGTLVIGTGPGITPVVTGYGQLSAGVLQAMESYVTVIKLPGATWTADVISDVLHTTNGVRPLGSQVFMRFL